MVLVFTAAAVATPLAAQWFYANGPEWVRPGLDYEPVGFVFTALFLFMTLAAGAGYSVSQVEKSNKR